MCSEQAVQMDSKLLEGRVLYVLWHAMWTWYSVQYLVEAKELILNTIKKYIQ